jgi:hypothetical protein
MLVSPLDILPSQDFLKPMTVQYIFDCLKSGELDKLPPQPIVCKDHHGQLVAVDGHNLIAVKHFLHEDIEVHLAKDSNDGVEEKSEADRARNQELREKFENILDYRKTVLEAGINTFEDLLIKYPDLFDNKTSS